MAFIAPNNWKVSTFSSDGGWHRRSPDRTTEDTTRSW